MKKQQKRKAQIRLVLSLLPGHLGLIPFFLSPLRWVVLQNGVKNYGSQRRDVIRTHSSSRNSVNLL